MYKQVIIARKDLGMSPGKLAAQVSHASMAFLTNMIKSYTERVCTNWLPVHRKNGELIHYKHPGVAKLAADADNRGVEYFYHKIDKDTDTVIEDVPNIVYRLNMEIDNDLFEQWINGSFTKCICEAKNKNKLLKAVEMADQLGMKENEDYFLIRDNCYTELEPEDDDGRTLTCIGFKPMDSEVIDKICKKFQLFK